MNNHSNVEQLAVVESIKRGEFVRKVVECKNCDCGYVQTSAAMDIGLCHLCDGRGFIANNKTYQRGEYDPSAKRYSLVDCDDANREVFVKKGTKLFVGFSY